MLIKTRVPIRTALRLKPLTWTDGYQLPNKEGKPDIGIAIGYRLDVKPRAAGSRTKPWARRGLPPTLPAIFSLFDVCTVGGERLSELET